MKAEERLEAEAERLRAVVADAALAWYRHQQGCLAAAGAGRYGQWQEESIALFGAVTDALEAFLRDIG